MERRGIKGEKKRREREVCRKFERERREERKGEKKGRRENSFVIEDHP